MPNQKNKEFDWNFSLMKTQVSIVHTTHSKKSIFSNFRVDSIYLIKQLAAFKAQNRFLFIMKILPVHSKFPEF